MYLDFHTHSVTNHDNTQSIYNVVLSEESLSSGADWCEKEAISLGIHPWYIEEDNLDFLYDFLRERGKATNVKCIGETGLDKLKGADLKLQESVFSAQIRIAEVLKKPVIIHCVRAFNEIISIQKTIKPKVPLIIHGFSRKSELVKELVSKGFYISFGTDLLNKKHVQDAFAEMPLDKFFLETDDKEDIAIQQIYHKAAELKGLDLENIKEKVWRNYTQIIKH
jgi:TatD DNase family protein